MTSDHRASGTRLAGRTSAPERAGMYLQVLRSLGHGVPRDGSILDFGCGAGEMVKSLLDAGYSARGCDIALPVNPFSNALVESGALAEIEAEPYRLPYPDGCFDAVISDQVFEHVMDYDVALDEIHRVLEPDGVTLHIFPSRLSLVEVHSRVPAAGFFRPYWWLSLWTHLGSRMAYQSDLTASQAARSTHSWLRENTNYHDRGWIRAAFEKRFPGVDFCEEEFLRQSGPGRCARKIACATRLGPAAYGAFRSRVVFAQK